MKELSKAKWTSVRKIHGWRHYEVLNVFKKKKTIEMFAVCKSHIKIVIPINDLKDKSKWINGWLGKDDKRF